MTTPAPTRHRGVYTAAADPATLAALARSGATIAVADPNLAGRLGPLPSLPPSRLRDCVVAESTAAGVPEAAVTLVVVALITEAAVPLLPPALAAVRMPATVIVGTEEQTAAVLAAAEAVAASRPGRAG